MSPSSPEPRLPRDGVGLPSPNPTKSYWLKELSPVLEGHRTTEELPGRADVVVVGSGVTGAFAGWFLKMGVGEDGEGEDDGEDSEVDEKYVGEARVQENEEADGIEGGGGCCGLRDAVTGLFRRDKRGEMGRIHKGNNNKGGGYQIHGDTAGPKLETKGSRNGKAGAQSVVMLEAREVCSGATGRVSLY